LNEPRSMPEEFFDRYPKIKGHMTGSNKVCMCTSTEEVQNYITESVSYICREVPLLGGFFMITRSENRTNCYSHSTKETCTCVRCSKRSESEVIAEVIGCVEKGAHQVSPDIKVIAWSWGWKEFNLDIIKALPEHVIMQSQSELDLPFTIGGVNGNVLDYSMSIIGPGERARTEWKAARERGLETSAKVQVNTTWEGSTVPALPVYPLVEEHIKRIRDEGVTNLMLSWTLGGYPSRNIMHAAKYFYERYDKQAVTMTENQKTAVWIFSDAFKEFPFHVETLYYGPQNGGPANLLFWEPTGYRGTMTCYAYDDLEQWRSIYPEDVYENQMKALCAKWEKGIALLETEASAMGEMEIMAQGAYCLFKSSLNQIQFYRARRNGDKGTMKKIAIEEISCAKKMLRLMNMNACIGFEAANHYYFSKGCLLEKIVNCKNVISLIGDDEDEESE